MSSSDCGYACLAMIVAWHGGHVTLAQLRAQAGEPRGGTRVGEVVELSRRYDLQSEAMRFERPAWSEIPRGSILHVEGSHYVVFDRMRSGGFDVIDPAAGRRWLPPDVLENAFEGVVVTLAPTPDFAPGHDHRSPFARYSVVLRGCAFG